MKNRARVIGHTFSQLNVISFLHWIARYQLAWYPHDETVPYRLCWNPYAAVYLVNYNKKTSLTWDSLVFKLVCFPIPPFLFTYLGAINKRSQKSSQLKNHLFSAICLYIWDNIYIRWVLHEGLVISHWNRLDIIVSRFLIFSLGLLDFLWALLMVCSRYLVHHPYELQVGKSPSFLAAFHGVTPPFARSHSEFLRVYRVLHSWRDLLGVSHWKCETPIVFVCFLIILPLPLESMAAHRTPWSKVLKFGCGFGPLYWPLTHLL